MAATKSFMLAFALSTLVLVCTSTFAANPRHDRPEDALE